MNKVFNIAFIFLLLSALPQVFASPYYTGDGGKGMGITILQSSVSGLAEAQNILPRMVEVGLDSNFSRYSAIETLDWQARDRVWKELESGRYGNNPAASQDFGNAIPTTHYAMTTLARTSTGFALQIQIARTADKRTAASYSGTCTLTELENSAAVQKASLKLLQDMGVALTAQAREELTRAATENSVTAQTALARGITAQRQGTEVAALSYFFQAAAFDPGLMEAVSRSSVLAANISSGSIGDDARNDIQWRKNWMDRLTETEKYVNSFFDNFFKTLPSPYTLFYTSDIKQVGDINYRDETVNLSGITTNLRASRAWVAPAEAALQSVQKSVQAVQDGLNATRRKAVWGLDTWPQQGAFNRSLFGRQTKNFTLVVELVNSRNQVIGRQSFQTVGSYDIPFPLSGNAGRIQIAPDEQKTVNFTNVKANDITDSLTVRIASVNGTPAETAARNGVLRIQALPKSEFEFYGRFQFVNGEIQSYSGNVNEMVVPAAIWGEPVTSVAASLLRARGWDISNGEVRAYTGSQTLVVIPTIGSGGAVTRIGKNALNNKKLTSVTIPNGVISIGESAFAGNQLTSVIIPNSVSSIGKSVFEGNKLTGVAIPNSVTSIGSKAFFDNQLTRVSIPNSLTSIGEMAFSKNQLASVIIPNSVISIGKSAFEMNQLTTVSIPNSVTSIEDGVFNRNQLTSVTFPNRVTSIGSNAFANNQLNSVTFPNSVTSISYNAFASNKLTSITIPNSVTYLGSGAFCFNQLTSVIIDKGVTSISDEAFALNKLLTSVTIGENVRIGKDVFSVEVPSKQRNIKVIGGNVYLIGDLKSTGFEQTYTRNGKKAGTYTYNGRTWNYRP